MRLAQLKVTIKGLFLAFGVAGLVSCGSGDETGGLACGGADVTGVCLFVESLVVSDVNEGPDIDTIRNGDCDGDGNPVGGTIDPEPFVIARSEVTFGADQIGPTPPGTTQIFIDGYTTTYTAVPPQPPLPPGVTLIAPAITSVTFTGGGVATIPVNGTATTQVDIFTFDQKANWVNDFFVLNGFLIGNVTYTVTYTFFGEDEFGESVSVTRRTFIDLDDFDLC